MAERCAVMTDVRTVDFVDVELADVTAVITELFRHVAVPAEVYWQVPEQRRRRPQTGQHRDDSTHRHVSLVAERIGHGDVAIDTDAAQMKQWRRAE